MNKTIGIIIGVVVLIFVIISVTNKKDQNMPTDISVETTAMQEEMIAEQEMGVSNGEDVNQLSGSYESYSPEKLARAKMGDVVLFFHASWCPSCRGLDADIKKNMSAIPENLSILQVDYDTETELKKKYGVTTQHTLVQVDAEGTMITKWSGGGSLESVVSQVQ